MADTTLPFTPRHGPAEGEPPAKAAIPLYPHPSAELPFLPPPAISVHLAHGERRRHYWIRPAKDPDLWYVQVFYGDLQHRGKECGYRDAERAYAEFTREIADARLDGWAVTAAPPRKPRKAKA